MTLSDWTWHDWFVAVLCGSFILYTAFEFVGGWIRAGKVVARYRVGSWRWPLAAGVLLAFVLIDRLHAASRDNALLDVRRWIEWLFLASVIAPRFLGRNALCKNGVLYFSHLISWSQIQFADWAGSDQLVLRLGPPLGQALTLGISPEDRDAVGRLIVANVPMQRSHQ